MKSLSAEIDRIVSLPVVPPSATEEAWLVWSTLLRLHDDAPFLRPSQGSVLEWLHRLPHPYGVFASAGVGSGKTLTLLLAAYVAGAKRPLALVPPGLEAEMLDQYEEWKDHYPLVKPEILPYSMLSRAKCAKFLADMRPDMIICDEYQNLKDPTATRTKRLRGYLAKNPLTRFVAMTGTPTGGSINDMQYGIVAALRDKAPVPRFRGAQDIFAAVVDDDGVPTHLDLKAVRPLVDWSGETNYRKAWHARCAASEGMVFTTEASVDIPIRIHKVAWRKSKAIEDALTKLTKEWELPNGHMITEASYMASQARYMAAGFYYIPADPPYPEWEEARAAWSKHLYVLKEYRSYEGFDSALLIENKVRASNSSTYADAKEALLEWDKHRHVKREDKEVVWIDREPLEEFLDAWLAQNDSGLIWYRSQAMGDFLRSKGLDVRGAGDPPPKHVPLAAVQIDRFNAGFNLQHGKSTQVFLEVTTSAVIWGQALARLHRPGQTADVVECHVYAPYWPQSKAFDKARERARSVEDLTQDPHRLLFAEIDRRSTL